MDSYPFVSIIVLNYNGVPYLDTCFTSLKEIDYPPSCWELLMPDNCSSDNSIPHVQSNFPWVKIIPFPDNAGFATGNNNAVEHARGDYIVFLNPDTKVEKNWLIELVRSLDISKSVVAAGSKVLFFGDEKIVQVAGSKMCLHGNGLNVGYGEKDGPGFSQSGYSMAPPGCSMIIKKDVFIALGGFDPDFFMYVEEFDLGYRLWMAGYKCVYVPTSVVYHEMNNFHFKVTPLLVYNEEKNRIATIIKNFEFSNVIKGLIITYLIFGYRILHYFFKADFKKLQALIVGNYQGLLAIPASFKKRKIIQSGRKLSDKEMKELGLLCTIPEMYSEFKRTLPFRSP
jgi:GT2 family glycosyltransferase